MPQVSGLRIIGAEWNIVAHIFNLDYIWQRLYRSLRTNNSRVRWFRLQFTVPPVTAGAVPGMSWAERAAACRGPFCQPPHLLHLGGLRWCAERHGRSQRNHHHQLLPAACLLPLDLSVGTRCQQVSELFIFTLFFFWSSLLLFGYSALVVYMFLGCFTRWFCLCPVSSHYAALNRSCLIVCVCLQGNCWTFGCLEGRQGMLPHFDALSSPSGCPQPHNTWWTKWQWMWGAGKQTLNPQNSLRL